MIASLEGTVGAVASDSLVIEVGGIGYRVFAAPAILAAAQPGSRLKLHTYHLVREDQQALYGFRAADDLGFFTLLLTVTGVGPRRTAAIRASLQTMLARGRPRRAVALASAGAAEHGPSVAMLLDHLDLGDAARRVQDAVASDLAERGPAERTTAQVGDAIAARIGA